VAFGARNSITLVEGMAVSSVAGAGFGSRGTKAVRDKATSRETAGTANRRGAASAGAATPDPTTDAVQAPSEQGSEEVHVVSKYTHSPIENMFEVDSNVSFTAGGTADCLDEWQSISNDQWIWNTTQGYAIEFVSEPIQMFAPSEIQFSGRESSLIDLEIDKMLSQNVIIEVQPISGQFISNIFTRPKKNGEIRPIINLKGLNRFVQYEHFKMESFAQLLEIIQPNDYLTSLDLKNAYYSIPIHENSRKYLRFYWQGVLYEFQALCFGLASAPRIFTKVMKAVFTLFRRENIRCTTYIDDSINMNQLFHKGAQDT
jgi:hypothetical protein